MISYGINVGVFYAISTLLNQVRYRIYRSRYSRYMKYELKSAIIHNIILQKIIIANLKLIIMLYYIYFIYTFRLYYYIILVMKLMPDELVYV